MLHHTTQAAPQGGPGSDSPEAENLARSLWALSSSQARCCATWWDTETVPSSDFAPSSDCLVSHTSARAPPQWPNKWLEFYTLTVT